MFHLMLGLPVIIVLAVVAFVVLLGIAAIVAALVGGTTVAVLVKNKTAKGLLVIGFCILFLVGFLCVLPILMVYLELSGIISQIVLALVYIAIAVLTILGIRTARHISNKIGSTLLVVVFSLVLSADIFLAIISILVRISLS